jgi:hypothetical protein
MPQYKGQRPATDTRLLLAIEILRSPAPFMPRDIAGVLAHWLEQVARRSGEHVPVAHQDYSAALEIADLAITRRHGS